MSFLKSFFKGKEDPPKETPKKASGSDTPSLFEGLSVRPAGGGGAVPGSALPAASPAPADSFDDMFSGMSLAEDPAAALTSPAPAAADLPPADVGLRDGGSAFGFIDSEPVAPLPADSEGSSMSAFDFMSEEDSSGVGGAPLDTPAGTVDSTGSSLGSGPGQTLEDSSPHLIPPQGSYTPPASSPTPVSPSLLASSSASASASTAPFASLPAAAPAPSPQPSAASSLASLDSLLSSAVTGHLSSLQAEVLAQSSLRRRQVEAAAAVRRATSEISDAEAAQAAAAEREEYDRAEQLNTTIERLRADVARWQDVLAAARREAQASLERRKAADREFDRVVAEVKQRLAKLREEQDAELKEYSSKEEARIEKETVEWSASKDRLSKRLSRLDADLKEAEAEEAGVALEISKESQEEADARDRLVETQQRLELEVDALRKQLAAKEAELASCRDALRAREQSIEEIKGRHRQRLNVISGRKEMIRQEEGEARRESDRLDSDEARLEADKARMRAEQERYTRLLASISGEETALSALLGRLEQGRARAEGAVRAQQSAAMAALQEELAKCTKAIEADDANVLSLEGQVARHKANVQTIDLKLPALQAEKQLAVAGRDYKKAGVVSKELNALSASKDESQAALEELAARVEETHAQLKARRAEKEDILARMQRAEGSADEERLACIIEAIRQVQRCASGLRSAESSPGVNAVDASRRRVESELALLDAEYEAYRAEAEEIIAKHGWEHRRKELEQGKEEEEEKAEGDVKAEVEQAPGESTGSSSDSGSAADAGADVPATDDAEARADDERPEEPALDSADDDAAKEATEDEAEAPPSPAAEDEGKDLSPPSVTEDGAGADLLEGLEVVESPPSPVSSPASLGPGPDEGEEQAQAQTAKKEADI